MRLQLRAAFLAGMLLAVTAVCGAALPPDPLVMPGGALHILPMRLLSIGSDEPADDLLDAEAAEPAESEAEPLVEEESEAAEESGEPPEAQSGETSLPDDEGSASQPDAVFDAESSEADGGEMVRPLSGEETLSPDVLEQINLSLRILVGMGVLVLSSCFIWFFILKPLKYFIDF